ncbi:MAG: hypothetical protein QOJ99_5396 [Bryobacterales bacterium]|jgi:hypothetical protein|nr:hypothetical protein [Bryobacterales bacterium]
MHSCAELRGVVERFVAAAAQPALLDPGEEPLRLIPDQWTVSEWNGRLLLQAWDAQRNLVRKVVSLKEQKRDRLSLVTERFPKLEGELQIADLAAPLGQELERKTSRLAFRDRFRLMLSREFPEWRIEEITTETNLEQSLSPTFVRAFLRVGATGMAVMGAPPGIDCRGIVAFGLIWLDYLRRRENSLTVQWLRFFVPASREREVVFRAGLLDPAKVGCNLHIFDDKDRTGSVDFEDAGNLDSTLPPCRRPVLPNSEPPDLPNLPGLDLVHQSDGSISLQVRGLEFARWSQGKLFCGIGRRKRCNMETIAAMAAEVARVRCGENEDGLHPLYTQCPEGWLESQVRANPQAVDASLLPRPIYGQVPVFGALDRGIIDLLGVDHTGRLVVIELKATADLQLPFQALDYWLRVRKHLWADDFQRLGYFSGVPLRKESPRILLVAPALEFHSTSEAILGYLSPQIEIARVGLAATWRKEVRVMFRLKGSDHP